MTDLGDELRSLASERELRHRRNLLVSLADAVEHGTGSDEWSSIDIPSALGGPIAIAEEAENRWSAALEIVRIVLIFGPILSTWYGLDRATAAYSSLTPAERTDGPSFFQQWLTGFDGKLGFTFHLMTVLTLTLVIAVIGVSMAIEFLRTNAGQPSQARHDNLSERLGVALAGASVQLATRRLSSPVRFREEMTRAADQLNSVLRVLRDVAAAAVTAATEANSTLASTQGAVAALTQASDTFGSSGQTLSAAAVRLREEHIESVEGLTLSVEAASRRVEDLLSERETRFDSMLTASRERDQEQVAALLSNFQAAVTEATRRMDRLTVATSSGLRDSLAPLSAQIQDLGAITSAARAAGPEAVGTLQTSLTRLERLFAAVVDRLPAPAQKTRNFDHGSAGEVDLREPRDARPSS